MFSHRFPFVFGLFTIVQGSLKTRSKVCRPSFKGMSKPFKAVFVIFPSKFAYLMASLVAHWSNTIQNIPPQYSFCSCKWKDTVANQFCNTLTHCAAGQHMGRAQKTRKGTGLGLRRGRSVRSFSKRWEIHQLHYCLQLHHFRRHLRTKICSVICCMMNPRG